MYSWKYRLYQARITYLLGSLVYVIWGEVIHYLLKAPKYDSFLIRSPIFFLSMPLFILSFTSAGAKYAIQLTSLVVYATWFHLIYLAYCNNWSTEYIMGLSVIFGISSFMFYSPRQHVYYTLVTLGSLLAIMYLYPENETLRIAFAHIVSIVAVVHFIVRFLSYQINQIDEKEAQLTAERNMARFMSDLAKQAAHDLRSPISAFSIAAEQLPQTDNPIMPVLKSASVRVISICEDLLRITKQVHESSSTEKLTWMKIDSFNRAIQSLVLEKTVGLKNEYKINYKQLSEKNIEFQCNSNSLIRLLSNLINNAAEAMGSNHGTITLSYDLVGDKAVFSVEDEGSGFSQQVIDSLGSPFNTQGKAKGTGLGLYYAKLAVESWGGNLNILNTGKGAKVEMYLNTKVQSK